MNDNWRTVLWIGVGMVLPSLMMSPSKAVLIKLAHVYEIDAEPLLNLHMIIAPPFFYLWPGSRVAAHPLTRLVHLAATARSGLAGLGRRSSLSVFDEGGGLTESLQKSISLIHEGYPQSLPVGYPSLA